MCQIVYLSWKWSSQKRRASHEFATGLTSITIPQYLRNINFAPRWLKSQILKQEKKISNFKFWKKRAPFMDNEKMLLV